jgi:hypothetical protein
MAMASDFRVMNPATVLTRARVVKTAETIAFAAS